MKVIIIVISITVLFIDLGETNSKFRPIRLSTNKQVQNLKEELDEATKTIELLKQSNASHEGISTLQRNIADLKRELDNTNQNSDQNIADWEQRVQDLTDRVEELTEKTLPADCIKNIELRDFTAAEEKLFLLNHNDTIVEDIVNKVYSGRSSILLLIDFGKSLTDIEMTLQVYRPLAYILDREVVTSYINELVALLKAVESEIINQSGVVDKTKKSGVVVRNVIRSTIQIAMSEILSKAMPDDVQNSNKNLAMYTVDSKLFYDAVSLALHRIYPSLETKKILEYFRKTKDLREAMDGLTALFYRMRNTSGDLHRDEIVQLALYIPLFKQQENYKNVPLGIRERFEELKKCLPKYLSALAFGDSQCFKNVRYNEYLFVGGNTRDSDRRYAFTWQLGTELCQGSWTVKRKGDNNVSIKNVNYNEHLCYSTNFQNQMYTWISGSDIKENEWRIISTEDGVRLQNMIDKDLAMTASEDTYNKNRRHVIAAPPQQRKENNDLWKIEICNYKC